MSFLYDLISKLKESYFIFLIVILLIVINDAIILGDFYILNSNKAKLAETTITKDDLSDKEYVSSMYVDIKGAVKKPGVYKIDDNMIVNDVIKLSGGLKKNASTENINLSKKVTNQMVIVVSTKESLKKSLSTTQVLIKNDAAISDSDKTVSNDTIASSSDTQNVLVNINNASISELMTIPGIGSSKAEAIVEYRKNNRFGSIEDIKNVTGIGESLFEKIRSYIFV